MTRRRKEIMRLMHLAAVMLLASSQIAAQQGKTKSPAPAHRAGASLADTMAFLQSKMLNTFSAESTFEYPCPPKTGSFRCIGTERRSGIWTYTDVAIEKCTLTMTRKIEKRDEIPEDPYYGRETWETTIVLPLSQIAFTSIKVGDWIAAEQLPSGGRILQNAYVITLPLLAPRELHIKHALSNDTDSDKPYPELHDKDPTAEKVTQWEVGFAERDVAERVSKAFQRAAELCGAKTEPF